MKFLITAGSSQAPIDRVRCVTNGHSHRVGSTLARTAWVRGHAVTVLTSEPEQLTDLPDPSEDSDRRVTVIPYRTFDDLTGLLQQAVKGGEYDAIFHAAAVSDYLSAGVYTARPGTTFNARTKTWDAPPATAPGMDEQKSDKIRSSEPELWVRLVRAPKLIERFRKQWGYKGYLVKFKQEAGTPDHALVAVAEKSRLRSDADVIVASTLESANHWAFVGPVDGRYDRIARRELADHLILTIEHVARTQRASNPDIGLGSNPSFPDVALGLGSRPDLRLPTSRSGLTLPDAPG